MKDRLRFLLNRVRERLWVKPLIMVFVSIGLVLSTNLADQAAWLNKTVPEIEEATIVSLLTILASSMLVVATFSVTSMVSAYATASNAASPRSFRILLADDLSQNALSTFIGAFIYSIVSLSLLKIIYSEASGRFALFALTLIVYFVVIITFVRWVDRIARLGRMESTVDKLEEATREVFVRRRSEPLMGGAPSQSSTDEAIPVFPNSVGYVQQIDMPALQRWAESMDTLVTVAALPGTFVTPHKPIAWLHSEKDPSEGDSKEIAKAFQIGNKRTYDEDPRFGLIVLSEIGSKALSSGINDPGTAIDVIGRMTRLFLLWIGPCERSAKEDSPLYDRVEVPALSLDELFDDAFRAIARDGSGTVEVAIRLQKTFSMLADAADDRTFKALRQQGQSALERARKSLLMPQDFQAVKDAAHWMTPRGIR